MQAFDSLRAAGYTGQLADMMAAWYRDNTDDLHKLGGDGWSDYWDGFFGASGGGDDRTINDVIAGLEGYFDRGYTATPWQNLGTESDIDLDTTNVVASAGAVDLGAVGEATSATFSSRLSPQATEDFTLVVAGVFDFATRNFAVGGRTSATSTLGNQGFGMAFRNDGSVRLYASDGTTIVSRTGLDVSAYADDLAVLTARFDRTADKMSLRVNGIEIGESGSIAALGSLEPASSLSIGTPSFPAQGVVSGVAWNRSVIPDADLVLIESAFGV